MPRNFGATAPGGIPATSRSTSVMGPGDDTADAVLRARQSTRNPAPFTAEHLAAYAAFAGITDRRTALDLHKAWVTWDDLDAYAATGIPATDYRRMIALRERGLDPATYLAWRHGLAAVGAPVRLCSDTALGTYVSAGVTVATVSRWFTPTRARHTTIAANRFHDWAAEDFATAINADLSPLRAHYFRKAGIETVGGMVWLAQHQVTPAVLTQRRTITDQVEPFDAREFLRLAAAVFRQAGDQHDLAVAVLRGGGDATTLREWAATEATPDRVTRFLACGITAAEYRDNPDLAALTDEVLAGFAALRDMRLPA